LAFSAPARLAGRELRFIRLRVSPAKRRLVTRALAVDGTIAATNVVLNARAMMDALV